MYQRNLEQNYNTKIRLLPISLRLLSTFISIMLLSTAFAQPTASQKFNTAAKEGGLVDFTARFWLASLFGFSSKTNMRDTAFWSERSQMMASGYRLRDLEIRFEQNQLLYSAVWVPGTGSEVCLTGLSWLEFEQAWEAQIGQGLILKDIESYTYGNNRFFAGVWAEGQANQQVILGPASITTFTQHHQVLGNQGFKLVDVEAFEDRGNTQMIGVWNPGPQDGIFLHSMSWNTFHKKLHELNDQDYRLSDFESHLINGEASYTGLWNLSTQEDLLVILDSSWDLDTHPNSDQLSGFSLIDLEHFQEDSGAESHHEESIPIGLTLGKIGGVIAPPDPTGTLMPLHNGGSTGPGN